MQLQPLRFHLFIFRTVLHLLSLGRSPFSLDQQNSMHYKGAAQGVRCNNLQVEYSCNKEIARLEMKVPGRAIACICFCVNMMSHKWVWTFCLVHGVSWHSLVLLFPLLQILGIDSVFITWISLLVIWELFLNSLCWGLLSLPVYLWWWLLHWHHVCVWRCATVSWWIRWDFLPES